MDGPLPHSRRRYDEWIRKELRWKADILAEQAASQSRPRPLTDHAGLDLQTRTRSSL